MKKALTILLFAALLLACNTREPAVSVDESAYSPSAIQKLATTDYDAAMRLTEEGLRKGQLTFLKANELRSNLTCQFTEDYAAAAAYLLRALEQKEAKDPDTRTDLLYHLATIYHTAKDLTPCLSACTEGKEVAHSIGRSYDEHAFDFLTGSCLWSMGEDETGLRMMTEALAGASAVARSEAQLGHLVRFTGQLINDYIDVADYEAALQQCGAYERLLGRMPDAPEAYLDRSRFYLDLDRAICYAKTAEPKKAREAFSNALGRRFTQSESGTLRLVDYYTAVGDPESILGIYAQYPYQEDTVSRVFRRRLARIRDAYRNAGDAVEAARWEQRYNALSQQLEQRENAEGTRVKVAQYDALHQRLLREDSQGALRFYRQWLIALYVLIFAALVALFLLNRRKQAQQRRHDETMEKDIRSLHRQVSLIAQKELETKAGEDQKRSLADLIEGKQLYLNPSLNRESAAELLGVSSAELSRMLNELQPGLGFPEYIKSLRLRHAIRLLGETPDISVQDLARSSGFYSVRTFQRSFLSLTGKTVREYVQELKR